jgi:rhodanese-related sulfurtransferase
MKRILVEGLVVAVAGAALAFLANAVSPPGLSLTTDYFKRSANAPVTALGPAGSHTNADPAKVASPAEVLAARLHKEGLQVADRNKAAELFHDPRCKLGLVVFVDARNDEEYAKGHVPGAWQFDRYHAEKFLPTVMPVCFTAEVVLVYCNGGECEDSEFTAMLLRDAGIPKEKLFVYPGGWADWSSHRMPVEVGVQNSGQVTNGQ